jgi:RNA 2',3'-cyclic 3'-phosphodiesterase
MRLFFALWPPPATARALADWARAAARDSGGRATAEEKIHLTLAFLGEAKPEKALAAARRVNGKKFNLTLEQAVYWQRNRIVWAGPQQAPPALLKMAETLQRELCREEFILERRAFAAHITLVREARTPGQLPELPILQWPVNEFLLIRSISGRYEPLERFPMA